MYAYEKAESILDTYAVGRKTSGDLAFYRTYRKMKCLIAIYAYMDFVDLDEKGQRHTPKQRLAWAWEDADIAFRGFSENILTGCVLQLWDNTKDEPEALQFHAVIVRAFSEANEATSADVARRYQLKWQKAAVRKGANDFALHIVLPTWGPKLREWAMKEGLDALKLEDQFRYLEEHERSLKRAEKAELDKVAKPGLVLLPGGLGQERRHE